MELINAFFSAGFVLVMMQITLRLLEKAYELNFTYKRMLIVSPSVLIVSASSAVMAGVVGFLKWNQRSVMELVLATIMIWGMGVLAITDQRNHVIPNRFLLVLLALWAVVITITLLWNLSDGLNLVFQSVFGGLIGGVIFFICYLLVKKQLGAGDVKLAVVMGLYLTSRCALTAYLIGTVICCIYSLFLVARKKLGWKDGVAMAPFLMVGTWITLLIE